MTPGMQAVNEILNRYANLAHGEVPDSLDADFKRILGYLTSRELGRSVSAAFRSSATPPVHEIVGVWFDTAQHSEKELFLKILRELLAQVGLDRLLGLIPHVNVNGGFVAHLMAEAEAQVPDIDDRLAQRCAGEPKLLLRLDRGTRADILRNMASHQRRILESILEESSAVPRVEEVTRGATRSKPPAASQPQAPMEPAPPPRFGSVELFEEAQPFVKGKAFGEKQTFQESRSCLAEVSILVKPRGVPPAGERRPVREPRQLHDVDILVTAESKDFEVSPRVRRITLPPAGDSTATLFRLIPLRSSASADDLLRVRFRFFYKLNLLQALTLRGSAIPAILFEDDTPSWQPATPTLFYSIQNYACDFDLIEPCALHISVDPDHQQFQMTFTFHAPGSEDLALPASAFFTSQQLADEIAGARKTLFRISSSPILGKQLAGSALEYDDHLKDLAIRGRQLWSLLFDRGEGQEMTTVGELLKKNPLPEGSRIQISVDAHAASFAFAWSLLYDQTPSSEDDYSDQGFWGLRYILEQRQVLPLPDAQLAPETSDVEIGAMYWKFSQTPAQQTYLAQLLQSSKTARLATGKPIDDAHTARTCIQSCSSHVLYFYSHGYTRLPDGEQFGVTVKDFLELFDRLPSDSPTRVAWQNLADDIRAKQFESDQSWIELTAGRLILQDLYAKISYMPLRPFVILNMCDSAQVTPALSQSFIDLFLTRGARAVIGTECSIRPVFADFVGRELLRLLLSAVPVGEALRQVRLEAARQKNLLGLAYTLFGFADAALRPALLAGPAGNTGPPENVPA